MLEYVLCVYHKYKCGLLCATLILVCEVMNQCEKYIMDHVQLTEKTVIPFMPGSATCPYKLQDINDAFIRQYIHLYFGSEIRQAFEAVRMFAPIFAYPIAGAISDYHGGHHVGFLGLLLASIIMVVRYFTFFDNNFFFLVLYGVRRFTEGVIWAANLSLVAKWAMPDERTTYCALLVAAWQAGVFLAYLVSEVLVDWRTVSYCCGVLGLVTSFWWWLLSRRPQFPPVLQCRVIPWRSILTAFIVYSACFLTLTENTFEHMGPLMEFYTRYVLFLPLKDGLQTGMLRLMLCLVGIVSSVLCGVCSDYVISIELMSVLCVRRTVIVFAFITVLLALVVVVYMDCNSTWALVSTVVISYAAMMTTSTLFAIFSDIAPPFAGTILGLAMAVAYTENKVLLYVFRTFILPPDHAWDNGRWQTLFFILFTIATIAALPYLCFNPQQLYWRRSRSHFSIHTPRSRHMSEN